MTKARDLANASTALSAVSATELGYVDGVTSAIQTQLDAKIPKSLPTAKGDILTATASGTPAVLAVGNSGEQIVADSSTATGLRYTENYAAGKNKIINGDFGIWQRGTSFTTSAYCSDRWVANFGSVTSPSFSRSTFTAGTAPVTGYEGTYYISMSGTLSDAVNGYYQLDQRIEDVRTFAGQTVTLSFWAKGSATGTISANISQIFGTGGSSNVIVNATNFNITTSWVRYSTTLSFPSISGKTIGTGSYARISISKLQGTASQAVWGAATFTGTLDVWGVQLEAGSVATAFQTATGTIQGELAACQRYYWQIGPGAAYANFGIGGFHTASNSFMCVINTPVTMRATPTPTTAGSFQTNGTGITLTSLGLNTSYSPSASFNGQWTCSGATTGYGSSIRNDNSTTAYIALSAEL